MPQNKLSSNPGLLSHLGREAVVMTAMSHLSSSKRITNKPPPVMTWGKALPVIVVAFIFDLVRIFFEWFWFFGPALGALACTAGVNGAIETSVAGVVGKAVAAVCTAGAIALGTVLSESTIAFGVVMADAVALIGWLTIGLWVFTTNRRIFKENGEDMMHVILLYLSILISFIPILGTSPTVGWITYRFFKFQIKIEREALRRYKEEQATEQTKLQQQAVGLMQAQAIEQEQAEQEDAQMVQERFEAEEAVNEPLPASVPEFGTASVKQSPSPQLTTVPNYT